MNRMLVSIFNSEAAADAGLQSLHKLHANGDLPLYAMGVLVRGTNGKVTVENKMTKRKVGLKAVVFGLLFGSWAQCNAQTPLPNIAPKEPIESGAIIVPPETDQLSIKRPAEGIDRGIVGLPVSKELDKATEMQQNDSDGKKSNNSTCKGSSALCEQNSPR